MQWEERILDELLRMPDDMRARIAIELLGSFSGEFELDEEQLAELERRLKSIEDGTAKFVNFEDAMRSIYESLKQHETRHSNRAD